MVLKKKKKKILHIKIIFLRFEELFNKFIQAT